MRDGSGGPEPRPESLLDPTLETDAHLGKARAPENVFNLEMCWNNVVKLYLRLCDPHLDEHRAAANPTDPHC